MPALITTTMAERQSLSEAINLFELEMKAREFLPQTPYDYYAGGANDEITLRENRVAYEADSVAATHAGGCERKAYEHDRAG
jgi:hypothetical protein